jgi:hypothetical protein
MHVFNVIAPPTPHYLPDRQGNIDRIRFSSECRPVPHYLVQLGRPIHIQSFGAISAKRLYQQITPQDHCRTVLVNIEALLAEVLPAASAAAGRPIRQALVIVDLKGFGLSQFWAFKSIARRFFDVSQNYFPETYVPALFPPFSLSTPSSLYIVAWAS